MTANVMFALEDLALGMPSQHAPKGPQMTPVLHYIAATLGAFPGESSVERMPLRADVLQIGLREALMASTNVFIVVSYRALEALQPHAVSPDVRASTTLMEAAELAQTVLQAYDRACWGATAASVVNPSTPSEDMWQAAALTMGILAVVTTTDGGDPIQQHTVACNRT